MSRGTRNALIVAYVVIGVLTLIYNIYVRSGLCVGGLGCLASDLKGFVWSVVWPAYWVMHFFVR